jgi:hypothetical protein
VFAERVMAFIFFSIFYVADRCCRNPLVNSNLTSYDHYENNCRTFFILALLYGKNNTSILYTKRIITDNFLSNI